MDKTGLMVVGNVVTSPLSMIAKTYHEPLLSSRDTLIKAHKEGLYHFTSEEAADKICESDEMWASNRFTSYGSKKCFFFAGVPDFDIACVNLEPKAKMTAVRVDLPYERLAEFDIRSANDGAISHKGNLDLTGAKVSKVRLGLKEKDGQLFYDEITEEQYKDYKPELSPEREKSVSKGFAFKVKNYITGMKKEFEMLGQNVKNFLKDESSYVRISPVPPSRESVVNDYMLQNVDLFPGMAAETGAKAR